METDKTDIIQYTLLAIVLLFVVGFIGWAIGNDQMQNEAILTHNAHWETQPNGHGTFKWNNL
jgi:hypothetical protein